eukprot:s504_g23.t1
MYIFLPHANNDRNAKSRSWLFPILPAPSKIEDTKRNSAILNSSGVASYRMLICGLSTGALSSNCVRKNASVYSYFTAAADSFLTWGLTLMPVSHCGMRVHCGKHRGECTLWALHVLIACNSKQTNLHQFMPVFEMSASQMTP